MITPDSADWAHLAPAAGSPEALASIQHRHRQGAASVIRISGDAAGTIVVWMERDTDGNRELVLGLGAGRGARHWIPWALAFARANKAATIRTHCTRAGLIRLYEKHGFTRAGADDEGFTVLRWHDGR